MTIHFGDGYVRREVLTTGLRSQRQLGGDRD